MKIVHTADWHIGKRLHKHHLYQDFDCFLDWFCQFIITEEVQVILISGDIFDLANPSAEARQQYYNALVRLNQLHCTVIITGGNHDSPAMLNAPKDLLKSLDVHVIGCMPESLEEVLIPLYENGEIKHIIAAIPYLRDSNLYKASQGTSYDEKLEAMREGIAQVYQEVAEIAAMTYPGIPCIAMGHLFAAGVTTSDSERDIQIGNKALFNALHFDTHYSYMALGHIHKPQQVKSTIPTYYSGSPLALSFSEREDNKRILLLDTNNGWEPRSIEIPKIRKLLHIKGNRVEIEKQLTSLEKETLLPCLLEVTLIEESYNTEKIIEFQNYIEHFRSDDFIIVKDRVQFKNMPDTLSEVFGTETRIEDLTPDEVFLSLLEQDDMKSELKDKLLLSFHEILESLEI